MFLNKCYVIVNGWEAIELQVYFASIESIGIF